LPLSRVIGDSQVRYDTLFIAALELRTRSGQVGLGFANEFALPPLAELERVFETEIWPGLKGQSIYPLLNHLSRPRGGNIRTHLFEEPMKLPAASDTVGERAPNRLWRKCK
jgi:hypothetical protein